MLAGSKLYGNSSVVENDTRQKMTTYGGFVFFFTVFDTGALPYFSKHGLLDFPPPVTGAFEECFIFLTRRYSEST